ncbi:MAG TPA: ferredoxin, partial [Ignavibacteria bacterium]|nr:ferredoxin [Ignavibacteria bacterium]
EDFRTENKVKSKSIKINDDITLNAAVVNGIGNIGEILDEIENGDSKHHFIEVMACPGGCINGGGQPIHAKPEKIRKRVQTLYEIDANAKTRRSYENESVQKLYNEFLEEPNSHIAHEILHTNYIDRKSILKRK